MTLPTYDSARDEMLGLFNTYWEANTPAVNGGSAVRVEWPGVDSLATPPANEPFARISINHVRSRQSSFGVTGSRRFTRPGVISVQCFSPVSKGGGLSFAEKTAIIARDAFEGKSTASGIWFRNARILEVGPDAIWFQFNMTIEFQYDELR